MAIVFVIAFYQVDFFTDFSQLDQQHAEQLLQNVIVSAYYVQILNLVFFIFFWYNYFQGQFIFSEYLTSILALYFLTILNEVYQLYYNMELMRTYENGLIFNIIINLGMIAMWLLRLHYLTGDNIKENEYYVLNYKILGKLMEQPGYNLLEKIFIKLGKQKIYIGSVILFLLAIVPVFYFGSVSRFSRNNIAMLLGFMAVVLILGILNTQKRWYDAIGHLIRKQKDL